MANLKDYTLTAEAAQILGVSQNTLRAWASDGRIPVRRNPANGYRLFLRSDLQKFLRTAAQVHSRTPDLPRPSRQADRTQKWNKPEWHEVKL